MKKLRLIPIITLLVTMLFVVRCSEDEKPLVKLTGKITFTDPTGASANAAGAVVYLATGTAATTTYEQSTIANADGVYTFSNLAPNSYFINSVYKTDNKNVTARLDGLTFTTAEGAIVAVGEADATQDLALVSIGQSGATFEALAVNYAFNPTATAPAGVATPGNYSNTGAWTYDGTHSPIAFEFPYRGQEADFFGAFSQLSKFVVNFDPANLATSSIDVEIDVASINTRNAGGRDPRTTIADNPPFVPATLFTEYGCIFGTFNIAAAVTPTDAVPQVITDVDRYATFKSTSIVKYGDGYVAKGNLKFNGFTVPVNMQFKQAPVWLDPSNNRKYSGFEGKFTMAAKKDYGVNSSSVNDALVKIQVSIVVYKQL